MDSDRQPKLNPVRAFQAMHRRSFNLEAEEAGNLSLSDLHDFEPSLEFDDAELMQNTGLAPLPPELWDFENILEEIPANDGIIEENFEEALATTSTAYSEITSSTEESFCGLPTSGVVEVVGDDEIGRRIIVVYACRLPPTKEVDPDVLLKYLMYTLDKYVEQDYSVVYFHHGLTSKNKPPLSWLWKAFRTFDRKYKKNLKALFLVHPTNLIRIVWQMLRPAISVKFGRKMMYVNYLHELQEHMNVDMLTIPQRIQEYNKYLLSKNARAAAEAEKLGPVDEASTSGFTVPGGTPKGMKPPPLQQFGVSLLFIKENNPNVVDCIPPIVRMCVEFLSTPEALETEGLFRRSTNHRTIKELQRLCNRGEQISFDGNPHIAAVLLKAFLRELEEPLLTFYLFKEIMKFDSWSKRDRPRNVKILIMERLPLENYTVLKYLIQFLWKVQDMSCLNKMTSTNLAVVFGPNLSWPQKGQMSLQSITPINAFTDYLLQNQESIFII